MSLTGPPAADLAVRSVEPSVSARAAYAAARASGDATGAAAAVVSAGGGADRMTRFADGGRASLALYRGASGYRLAWRVLAPVSSTGVYDVLVDARTAAVVRRSNRVNFGNAKVFEYTPAHGAQVDFDFDTGGASDWLSSSTPLFGPNAHAFLDTHDVVGFDEDADEWNFTPEPGSDVTDYDNVLQTVPHHPNDFCAGIPSTPQPPPTFACSWDPTDDDPIDGSSWQANRDQSATQLFYYVNRFHDHLENDPDIAFTQGNFEGSDRVLAQALDGADTARDPDTDELVGLPDQDHFNNANFTTLPEGEPGLMQIYLWQPDPNSSNDFGGYDGANDASLVYHEYTHGLSNRLVTDAQGFGALNTAQAGALGEGWSDFYAMDFIEAEGHETDDLPAADLYMGDYIDNGGGPGGLFRNQAIDCSADSTGGRCTGGYTYADFAQIDPDGHEVHADGEIWAQTVWSIRTALIAKYTATLGAVDGREAGIAWTRKYVTEGMRQSPPEPSFLDARNSIIQASTVNDDDETMWQVFAIARHGLLRGHGRQRGHHAGGRRDRPRPADRDRHDQRHRRRRERRPARERDRRHRRARHGSRRAAVNHDRGRRHVHHRGRADQRQRRDVPDGAGDQAWIQRGRRAGDGHAGRGDEIDFDVVRDWSSSKSAPSAADVASFTGSDNSSSGCGPGGLIDDDPRTVWGTSNTPGGQEIVIELAAPIDVGRIAIDPAAGCGDDDTAALGEAEVLGARTPGGQFESLGGRTFVEADNGELNDVPFNDGIGIRYIKLRALSPQDATEGEDGERFIDIAELVVERLHESLPGVAANSGAAHDVGTNGASLTGTLVPHSSADQVWFEVGTTTTGMITPVSAGGGIAAGETAVPVGATLGGLQPATRYYFQLVARHGLREYRGGIGTFVTAPAPQPPPSNPPPSNPPPSNPPGNPPGNPPDVRPTLLLDTKLTARRKGTFKVRAFFGDAAPAGNARFTVLNKRTRYARATSPVRVGGNVTKTLQLTKRALRAIAPGRSKRVTLELRLPNGQKIKKSLRLARSKR